MAHNDPSINAYLENGNGRIPVSIKDVSKYSLLVRTLDNPIFAHGSETFSLIIQNNGKRLELGPCGIVSEPTDDEFSGRLIFLADVYDMHSLLFEDKVVKLQSTFGDLPLLLARRDSIKQSFKEFVTHLTYDLNVYKRLFDDLDYKCEEEPEEVRTLVQQAVIETEGKKFKQFFHSKVQELDDIVSEYSREAHQLHGFYFRRQLWNFILCCPLMARTNLKPRGYAGDSEMMRMIYLNDYQGDSTFSKLMQKYTVGTPAAQSVRNRRMIINDTLLKFADKIHSRQKEKLRILSVACGPASEIEDILVSKPNFEKYHFTLLDQDRMALNDATRLVDKIEKISGAKVQVDYVQASVRTMLADKTIMDRLGKFHFIYSMGLFDYLSTPVAKIVIESLYRLLKQGGELIIGNFHVSNPSRNFMEYWGDWYLIHRTESEIRDLLPDADSADAHVIFEETRSQMFLHAKKKRLNSAQINV
jgi:extracellular factor (EF) 3-hydroxypalmitic acid methyl ester biosynthesis protein